MERLYLPVDSQLPGEYASRMNQLSIFGAKSEVWTVARLNRQVREILELDYRLQNLWVMGEIANLSRPASGHLYFTLRDRQASVRCVMWRQAVAALESPLADGAAVEVHGSVALYEDGGVYQLLVDDVRPTGEGVRYQEFIRLKKRLEAEGLFLAERKRRLPEWPRQIGVITSASGAALQDVLNVLERRYPLGSVVLAPSAVQGEAAPGELINAFELLQQQAEPDVILLVRGGGSIEDLWAFNDEQLARVIAASPVPVVSGVGHETDFTIADFVADQRAPTPTAAAELATPDLDEVQMRVEGLSNTLAQLIRGRLRTLQSELRGLQWRLERRSPQAQIANARQRVDEIFQRIHVSTVHRLALRRESLSRLAHTLGALGPESVLQRGYALLRKMPDGSLVNSTEQVAPGEQLEVRVRDGTFGVKVDQRSKP